MIFERWQSNFDIDKLKSHLSNEVLKRPITRQTEAFGGWSVLSGDGDIKDGWQRGHLLLEKNIPPEMREGIQTSIKKRFAEYTVETEICTGYLKDVIDTLSKHLLSPCRARIICLTAGTTSSWHRDTQDCHYAVRLHVPIITNPHCFFETRDERDHLAADGSSYFLYVNREHRVVNFGTDDRYHLVVDVVDKNQFTKFHRKEDFNIK